MDSTLQYTTVSIPGESLYREKGSKFSGFCFQVSTADEVKSKLNELRILHPDSRHVCYGYLLRSEGKEGRCSDDGEPVGTAGKPILNQIYSSGCENVLIAVVRYFGGIKLGTSGLIQAYKTAAGNALSNAELMTAEVKKTMNIFFPFHLEGKINSFIKKNRAEILSKEFGTSVRYTLSVPLSDFDQATEEIRQLFGVELMND